MQGGPLTELEEVIKSYGNIEEIVSVARQTDLWQFATHVIHRQIMRLKGRALCYSQTNHAAQGKSFVLFVNAYM